MGRASASRTPPPTNPGRTRLKSARRGPCVEHRGADALDISRGGPLLVFRMSPPAGEPLRIEEEVFAAAGLSPGDFRSPHLGKVRGARRPLRVRPADVELAAGVDEHGP